MHKANCFKNNTTRHHKGQQKYRTCNSILHLYRHESKTPKTMQPKKTIVPFLMHMYCTSKKSATIKSIPTSTIASFTKKKKSIATQKLRHHHNTINYTCNNNSTKINQTLHKQVHASFKNWMSQYQHISYHLLLF